MENISTVVRIICRIENRKNNYCNTINVNEISLGRSFNDDRESI